MTLRRPAFSANAWAVLRVLERPPLSSWSRSQLIEQTYLDDRAIREAIHELRVGGIAVLSPPGYWLGRNATEIAEFRERQLHHRIRELAAASRGLREAERALSESPPPVQTRLIA